MTARPIIVIGDCTLDVTISGAPPLRRGGDVPASIGIRPGGQAANVAVRLARRGLGVRLVAPVGHDGAGRLLREAMAAEGVDLVALATPRSALVVAMLDRDGERAMASDRVTLDPQGVRAAMADAAGWVHCSGYALVDDASADELADALANLPTDVRRSVAGGSIPVDPVRVARLRRRLELIGPQLLVVNRDEAAALLGHDEAAPGDAAARLAGVADVVVVTAGSEGSAASAPDGIVREAAPATEGEPVDATGAGDAFAAVLIGELHAAGWPPQASALRAAMRAAGELGSRVARVLGAQARVAGEPPP